MRSLQQGFTLPELMVSIAVLAIIAGLATPTFTELMERQRVDTTSQTLLGSLHRARLEAVTSQRQVAVFARDGDWSKGWLIAIDHNCNDDLDAADEVLEHVDVQDKHLNIWGNQAAKNKVSYNTLGEANLCHGGFIAATLGIGSMTYDHHYAIKLNAAGRARLCRANKAGACLGEPK